MSYKFLETKVGVQEHFLEPPHFISECMGRINLRLTVGRVRKFHFPFAPICRRFYVLGNGYKLKENVGVIQ